MQDTHHLGPEGSGTGPILLSQATFLLAHIANSGPVPLSSATPAGVNPAVPRIACCRTMPRQSLSDGRWVVLKVL